MATGQALFVPMLLLCSAVSLAPARADIVVSSDPSQNMSCSAGVCVPTASSAVLNVNDLETLLSSGNVKVTTTGSGVQANDIDIAAALGWSNASALALDAYDSISINSAVAVSGAGGVSLTTNDGGSGGEISFGSTGDVSFTNLSSALTINGSPFQLVGSISDLATAIANNPSGAYALAANYDASADGTYSQAPIQTVFTGTFEGLGNTISSLSIHDVTDSGFDGLFEEVGSNGTVRDIGLSDASVDGPRAYRIGALAAEIDSAAIVSGAWSTGKVLGGTSKAKKRYQSESVGGLIGASFGTVQSSSSTAVIKTVYGQYAGGLVGINLGTVASSHADGAVSGKYTYAGGLSGESFGAVSVSYATGNTKAGECSGGLLGENNPQDGAASVTQSYAMGKVVGTGMAGGLVCYNGGGTIEQSYSVGAVTGGDNSETGGLLGYNDDTVIQAYSTGSVSAGTGSYVGGFVGYDTSSGRISDAYWDTKTSGIGKLSQGAGNIADDPGITGLTSQRFRSRLPKGFDRRVWAEGSKINNGFPYLVSNPPHGKMR